MAKIVPIRRRFESMRAMLAAIAEDDEVAGFVGCVLRKDGIMRSVHFNITTSEMSFAAAMLLRESVEDQS